MSYDGLNYQKSLKIFLPCWGLFYLSCSANEIKPAKLAPATIELLLSGELSRDAEVIVYATKIYPERMSRQKFNEAISVLIAVQKVGSYSYRVIYPADGPNSGKPVGGKTDIWGRNIRELTDTEKEIKAKYGIDPVKVRKDSDAGLIFVEEIYLSILFLGKSKYRVVNILREGPNSDLEKMIIGGLREVSSNQEAPALK